MIVLCVTGLLVAGRAGAIPAFPGAEGFGANTPGGRGGSVYHVTNTNDSGAGSLRTGVGTANRTIVFDVSGTINLASDLKITRSNITVAGQTAPGDGITLKGRMFSVENTHDVIVRFIRCRPGDVNCPGFQGDSFDVLRATNVVVDHVTASWSIDECLSPTHSTNVTLQWCVIGASLNDSCHVKGAHGYGSLIRYGAGRLSLHHNLYVHNRSRNPRPGDNMHVDFVNNVVYNWGDAAGYNANDTPDNPGGFTNALNYVGNYLIAGPSTSGNLNTAFDSGVTNAASLEIYQSGNYIDGNKNGLLDGANTGWGMFSSPYRQLTGPFTAPTVTTNSALIAYERVLAFVGASSPRDAVDQRVVNDVRLQTGSIINSQTNQGGWPTLNSLAAPTDTDQDGIPDYWEAAMGWSVGVANNNHVNSDGYTDLEWYLNWLAAPHAVCDRNGSADANLRGCVGGSTNLNFVVANGTNGTVALLGDGYTARFTATNDFTGMAYFTFDVTDPAVGASFGPVAVNVLVTTTNAPNTAPTLAPISNQVITAGTTLTFTNSASDTDQPTQTLAFTLWGAPAGATVGTNDGVFNWRPTMAQGDTTNPMSVVVSDSGTPSLSATQGFSVTVNLPARPQIQPPLFVGGQFSLTINGDAGPDYLVQASTNLFEWATIFSTNSPALPLAWTDFAATNFDRRFYRVLLGP